MKANSKQRARIFRNLFQTESLNIFQRYLSNDLKKYRTAISVEEKNKFNILWDTHELAEIYPDKTNDDLEVFLNNSESENELLEKLLERLSEFEREVNLATKNLAKLEEQKNKAVELYYAAEQLDKLFLDTEKLSAELKKMHEESEKIGLLSEKYQNAVKADKLSGSVEHLNYLSKVLQDFMSEMSQAEHELEKLKIKVQNLAAEKIAAEKNWGNLENIKILLKEKQVALPQIIKLEAQKDELEVMRKNLLTLTNEFGSLRAKQHANLETIAENNKILEENKDFAINKLELEQTREALVQQKQALIVYGDEIVNLNLELDKKVKLDEDYIKNRVIVKEQVAELERIERAFLGNQAAFLADNLLDGEACPVCGSTEHPKKAVSSNNIVSQADWETARKSVRLKETQLDEIVININKVNSNLENKIASLEKNLFSNFTQDYATQENSFSAELVYEKRIKILSLDIDSKLEAIENKADLLELKLKQIYASEEKITLAEKENTQLLAENNQLVISINKNIEQKFETDKAISALESLINDAIFRLGEESSISLKEDISNLEKNIKSAESEISRVEKLEVEQENKKNKLIHSIETFAKNIAEAELSHREYSIQLYKNLRKNGFIDIASYEAASIPSEEQDMIKQYLESYSANLQHKSARFAELQSTIGEQSRPNLEKLKEDVLESEQLYKSALELINISKQKKLDLQRTIKLYKKSIDSLTKLREAEAFYAEMSGLTSGQAKHGKLKLTFEQYVQVFYFRRIIAAANLRLEILSAGRYILEHREERSAGAGQDGLELNVVDSYTGKSRSVKSLSGGETFMASIALALGLSDTIREMKGGLEIDVMFIDEGFESLDQDSLQRAAKILSKISRNDCLVGIISHVNELKDTIPQQIQVRKSKQGSDIIIVF